MKKLTKSYLEKIKDLNYGEVGQLKKFKQYVAEVDLCMDRGNLCFSTKKGRYGDCGGYDLVDIILKNFFMWGRSPHEAIIGVGDHWLLKVKVRHTSRNRI